MLHLSAVLHYTMSRGLIIVFLQDQRHTHTAGFAGIIFIRRHLLRSWRPPIYMPPPSPSSGTLSIFYDYYFFKLLCVDCSVLPLLNNAHLDGGREKSCDCRIRGRWSVQYLLKALNATLYLEKKKKRRTTTAALNALQEAL